MLAVSLLAGRTPFPYLTCFDERTEMRLYLLGARLTYVESCPDDPDRRHAARCYLVGELLCRPHVQRVHERHRTGDTGYRRYLRRLRLRGPDDHHEQLIGADQRHRWPCGDRATEERCDILVIWCNRASDTS